MDESNFNKWLTAKKHREEDLKVMRNLISDALDRLNEPVEVIISDGSFPRDKDLLGHKTVVYKIPNRKLLYFCKENKRIYTDIRYKPEYEIMLIGGDHEDILREIACHEDLARALLTEDISDLREMGLDPDDPMPGILEGLV